MRKEAAVLILFFCLIRLNATNYYVSNEGNDLHNGLTPNTSWKTIKKVNEKMGSFLPGDSILFHRGDYWNEQLKITADGSAQKDLVFSAYSFGNEPVLSGSMTIANWSAGTNGLYFADLQNAPNIVLRNSQIVAPSRWPEDQSAFSFPDNSGVPNYITDAGITLNEINPGAVCHIKLSRYYISHVGVNDYQPGSKTIYTDNVDAGTITKEYGYFLTGVTAAINDPGEWAYDSEKQQIFISGDPSSIEVGSIGIVVIISSGANYVTLNNLLITGGNLTGLSIQANSATVKNCLIENNFDTGIRIDHASNVRILNNQIANIYGQGIFANYSDNLSIIGNYIANIGTSEQDGDILSSLGEGMWIGSSANLKVKGNHIKNCGRTGINLYSNAKRNRTISYNLIENTMLSSDDGGAIYTAPDVNSLSTWDSIHHNIIINSKGSIKGTTYKEAEAVGIYIDEPQSGGVQENWVIRENSVSNTYYGIYLHDARNCKIESNLLFKCSTAVLMNDEKQNSADYRMSGVSIVESSILAENNNAFLFMVVDAYSNFTYPANSDRNVFANQEQSNFVHTYNHSSGSNALYTLNQWNTLSSLDQNSIITKVPSQFNKKLFIYNPTYKSSIVTFQEGCQYRTLMNEEVNQTVVLEPYMADAFYATSSTGADCTPLVEENPLNSPPVINVPSATQSINENASLIFSTANNNSISISDPDNNTSIVTVTAINGSFSFSGTSGLTFSAGDGSNDMTMICSGLITNLNKAFNAAVFKPTSGFAGSASVLINVKDGGGESDNGTVHISVAAINDAPVISVPSSVQNTNANTALVFSTTIGNRISVADPDNSLSTVSVMVTNGTFSLSGTSGMTFTTGDGTDDITMTFSGLITGINSILNGSAFRTNPGYSGAASITVSVNDGLGGTDSENIIISVSSGPNAINKIIKKLLSFYPNPASDHIIIKFDEDAINKGKAKLELRNISGQVVQSSIIENIESKSEIPVDLRGYKSGPYLIVLTLGNEQQISKLIISNPNGGF